MTQNNEALKSAGFLIKNLPALIAVATAVFAGAALVFDNLNHIDDKRIEECMYRIEALEKNNERINLMLSSVTEDLSSIKTDIAWIKLTMESINNKRTISEIKTQTDLKENLRIVKN